MLAATARRCPAGARAAAERRAAGSTRSKSAVAAAATASENVKNFKIYRWDPNEKVGFCFAGGSPHLPLAVPVICDVGSNYTGPGCSLTEETAN